MHIINDYMSAILSSVYIEDIINEYKKFIRPLGFDHFLYFDFKNDYKDNYLNTGIENPLFFSKKDYLNGENVNIYYIEDYWLKIRNNFNKENKNYDIKIYDKAFHDKFYSNVCVVTIPLKIENDYLVRWIDVISINDASYLKYFIEKSSDDLILATKIFYLSLISHRGYLYYVFHRNFVKISDSEKAVLDFLISGRPMREIPQYSKHPISTRYAEKILSNIKEKLGGITTNELVYLLGKYGYADWR